MNVEDESSSQSSFQSVSHSSYVPKSLPNDSDDNSSREKFYILRYGVEQDSNISAASPDGNVGIVPIFKPKVSGLVQAMAVQFPEEDKEEREKQIDLMTVNNCHAFSAEGFFESQSMMTSMREQDPGLYAYIKDKNAIEKG